MKIDSSTQPFVRTLCGELPSIRIENMKKIYVVTHTEATHHIENKVGGWFDSDLTEKGVSDAKSVCAKLREIGVNLSEVTIYASDLNRTSQTANIIAREHSGGIVYDRRLREMSFGDNEGMDQELHNHIMKPTSDSGERLDHKICAGAESRRDVAMRVSEFVLEMMSQPGDAVIITHGFAGSFVIAAFQCIDISSMGYIDYKLNSGSLSILETDDLFQNRSIKLLNFKCT